MADTDSDLYLVWSHEHGCWWRPASAGYTTKLEAAGRYTRDEAIEICGGCRNGFNPKHIPSELPIAERDINAMIRGAL